MACDATSAEPRPPSGTPGGIVNLHSLPGAQIAEATGVNNFGRIVGTSFDASGNARVFLWEHGRIYDLNTLVQPNPPLYLLLTGDINDRGEITGLGCVLVDGACGSEMHTFVAIVAPGSGATGSRERLSQVARPRMSDALRSALRQHRLVRFGEGITAHPQ